MSYTLSLQNIIPSLWSEYPEFKILKYVCVEGSKNPYIKHIDLDDVILNPALRIWFINYFNFDLQKLNYILAGSKGLLNCIKFLEYREKIYPRKNLVLKIVIYLTIAKLKGNHYQRNLIHPTSWET